MLRGAEPKLCNAGSLVLLMLRRGGWELVKTERERERDENNQFVVVVQ